MAASSSLWSFPAIQSRSGLPSPKNNQFARNWCPPSLKCTMTVNSSLSHIKEFEPKSSSFSSSHASTNWLSVAFPATASSNILFCKPCNVEMAVGENESEDSVVYRFKKLVRNAGVIEECKRRMHYENKQDVKKRLARAAAMRNCRRRVREKVKKKKTQKLARTPRKQQDGAEFDYSWREPEDWKLPYCK